MPMTWWWLMPLCLICIMLAVSVRSRARTESFTAFVAPETQLRHTLTYRWMPSLRTYYDPLHDVQTDPLTLTLKQASPRFEWLMYRPGVTTQPGVWFTDALSAFAAGAPPLLTVLHPQDPMVFLCIQTASGPQFESPFDPRIRRVAYAHPQAIQLFKALRFSTFSPNGSSTVFNKVDEHDDMVDALEGGRVNAVLVYARRHDPFWKRLFFELRYRNVPYTVSMEQMGFLRKTIPFMKKEIVTFQEGRTGGETPSIKTTDAAESLIVDRVTCLTPETPKDAFDEHDDLMAVIVKAVGVATYQDTAHMTRYGFESLDIVSNR